VGLPRSLCQALKRQRLRLSVASMAALTPDGQPLASCPLLAMRWLRQLTFHQPTWSHADVTALLQLQKCFQVKRATCRGGGHAHACTC